MENVEAVGAAQTVIAQADKFAKISLQIELLLFQINLTVLVSGDDSEDGGEQRVEKRKMSWRLGGDVSEEEENDVMKGSIWFD